MWWYLWKSTSTSAARKSRQAWFDNNQQTLGLLPEYIHILTTNSIRAANDDNNIIGNLIQQLHDKHICHQRCSLVTTVPRYRSQQPLEIFDNVPGNKAAVATWEFQTLKLSRAHCPSYLQLQLRQPLSSKPLLQPWQSSAASLPTTRQFFHTTTKATYQQQNPHDKELVHMMLQKPVDFQAIDKKLEFIYHNTGQSLNIRTFIGLVKMCIRMKNHKAAEAGEKFVFEWMMKFYQQNRLGKADLNPVFGMAMQAWVKTKHPSSGNRAENLLAKLEEMQRQGILPFAVDTTKYNTVIKAYAIHGNYENARAMFDRCRNAFELGNESARPDVLAWNTLLDACAKSNNPDSWKIAENLFGELQTNHTEGILKDPPNTITYSSIIHACAKCNQPERAEFWLEEMYKDYQSGNESAQPNEWSFNTVINAWAVLGKAEEAELFFQRMMDDYKKGTEEKAKPDIATFTTLLQAYSNAKLTDAGEKADGLLEQMKQLELDIDAITLTPVFRCWECSIGHDPKAKERCEELQSQISELRKNPAGD